MTTQITRLIRSIDALALACGVSERHHLDTLVGIAARELAAGKRDIEALEAARLAAHKLRNQHQAAEQIIARIAATTPPMMAL